MISILGEISKLRKDADIVIDYKNINRYRVVIIENNGSRTSYYFAVPMYNVETRKTIDMKFLGQRETFYYTGSNANIIIGKDIKMENNAGTCKISLAAAGARISDNAISCADEIIFPTTNGVAIKSSLKRKKTYSFCVEVSKPFLKVRANDKYFALMNERFTPFFYISCIGTLDATENIISPAKLNYQKITDRKYVINITPSSDFGKFVLIESNLYEPKLFQDTTVESKSPKNNNVFGGIGFIGTTKEFGEQWLYTRPDFSKMTELNDKKIIQAILHIPKLNNSTIPLTASKISARFCSFGSQWNNKIPEASTLGDSEITEQYINLNITSIFTDKYGRFSKSEGIILKSKIKGSGFSVISTGDNNLNPQILEINYT